MPAYSVHDHSDSPVVFNISDAGITHTGNVRSRNEDSILLHTAENTWAIADGMGGHHAGDFASQTITHNLNQFKRDPVLAQNIRLLEENILQSHSIIQEKSGKLGPRVMIGSTVVCVHVWQGYLFVLWAGDSRLYRYREGQLARLTEDHSYVEELVRMGKLNDRDADAHPAANVLVKAVGIERDLRVDFDLFEIQDKDFYLICSDGLYKELGEDKIVPIIESNHHDMNCLNQALLDASLVAGGSDNISIITLKASYH